MHKEIVFLIHAPVREWLYLVFKSAMEGALWATCWEMGPSGHFSYRFVRWRGLSGPPAGKGPPEASFGIDLTLAGAPWATPQFWYYRGQPCKKRPCTNLYENWSLGPTFQQVAQGAPASGKSIPKLAS